MNEQQVEDLIGALGELIEVVESLTDEVQKLKELLKKEIPELKQEQHYHYHYSHPYGYWYNYEFRE